MKVWKQLTLAALLALSLSPAANAASDDFDDLSDLDEIMPTFCCSADGHNDDLMPTW